MIIKNPHSSQEKAWKINNWKNKVKKHMIEITCLDWIFKLRIGIFHKLLLKTNLIVIRWLHLQIWKMILVHFCMVKTSLKKIKAQKTNLKYHMLEHGSKGTANLKIYMTKQLRKLMIWTQLVSEFPKATSYRK